MTALMAPASQLLGTGNILRKRAHWPPSARRSPATFSFRLVLYSTFSSSFLNPETNKTNK
ncbi:Os03g0656051 [Oryza sativa Japonica Group]|uniref:Os03g0656051 protein n=1 Tax=Oryza sativa subsp. japonica TaxID=39947 RepID=A0A0P0W0Y6_ORYSJ|nr:hypothetical protein EE612_019373 [Oryza sativa]BAS85558.1 Os03g0656051 [Oryza sativa Japonica Group]